VSASKPTVAVLATMNTKGKEARFIADMLTRAGVRPWIVDLSLKPHDAGDADMAAANVAAAAGAAWQTLNERTRQDAAAVMIEGGAKMLLEKFAKGEVAGAIGLGGANGTNLVCSILRALPYLVPKVVVSTVAGTAAVQWYVASGEGRDKAGGYAIQGLASRFVARIEGSYSNVVGLPVATVYRLIEEIRSSPTFLASRG